MDKTVLLKIQTNTNFTNTIEYIIIVNRESAKIKCLLFDNHFINIVSSLLKTERLWVIYNDVRHIKMVHLDERLVKTKSFKVRQI